MKSSRLRGWSIAVAVGAAAFTIWAIAVIASDLMAENSHPPWLLYVLWFSLVAMFWSGLSPAAMENHSGDCRSTSLHDIRAAPRLARSQRMAPQSAPRGANRRKVERVPVGLLIQPHVVKPPVGVDIVLVKNEILDVMMPTQSGNGLVDDGPGDILGQFFLHRPYELLARRKIGLL
jgi:hypothetical protein